MRLQTEIRALVALACFCTAGCEKKHEETGVQSQSRAELAEQDKLVAETEQTYRAMDEATLLKNLNEQSVRKREPFNSLAYRELIRRNNVDPKQLVALIGEKKNGDSLLPLLLLRKLDQKTYEQLPAELRSSILTDALAQSKTFNTWGLPGFYLEDASKALLETGDSSIPALRLMLSDTRPATVYGGKQHMIYVRYRFRLCDYALYFLKRLQGEANFVEPVSVADRDTLIKQMAK